MEALNNPTLLQDFMKNGSYVGVLEDMSFAVKQIYYLLGSNMPDDLYSRLKDMSDQLNAIVFELKYIAENE